MTDKNEIKVIIVNKPTKIESEKKIKDLCDFLEKVWFLPIKLK